MPLRDQLLHVWVFLRRLVQKRGVIKRHFQSEGELSFQEVEVIPYSFPSRGKGVNNYLVKGESELSTLPSSHDLIVNRRGAYLTGQVVGELAPRTVLLDIDLFELRSSKGYLYLPCHSLDPLPCGTWQKCTLRLAPI